MRVRDSAYLVTGLGTGGEEDAVVRPIVLRQYRRLPVAHIGNANPNILVNGVRVRGEVA